MNDLEGHDRSQRDILFVGRTDYRLTIHSPVTASGVFSTSLNTLSAPGERRTSPGIQDITYSTYTPNSFDRALAEYWTKAGSSELAWKDADEKSLRVELGHEGVAYGVEQGGGVKWNTKLGSIG